MRSRLSFAVFAPFFARFWRALCPLLATTARMEPVPTTVFLPGRDEWIVDETAQTSPYDCMRKNDRLVKEFDVLYQLTVDRAAAGELHQDAVDRLRLLSTSIRRNSQSVQRRLMGDTLCADKFDVNPHLCASTKDKVDRLQEVLDRDLPPPRMRVLGV